MQLSCSGGLAMEQQKALGLKSLPRATMTPASSMALARGCGSLNIHTYVVNQIEERVFVCHC